MKQFQPSGPYGPFERRLRPSSQNLGRQIVPCAGRGSGAGLDLGVEHGLKRIVPMLWEARWNLSISLKSRFCASEKTFFRFVTALEKTPGACFGRSVLRAPRHAAQDLQSALKVSRCPGRERFAVNAIPPGGWVHPVDSPNPGFNGRTGESNAARHPGAGDFSPPGRIPPAPPERLKPPLGIHPKCAERNRVAGAKCFEASSDR